MNTRNSIISSLAAAAIVGGAAHAEVFSGNGGAVADNNATGSTFVINVNQSLIMSGVSVTLTNFQHNYLGDLTASLTHVPSGITVSLFDRIGKTSASSGSGDSSNFNGTYIFSDGGANLWSVARDAGSSGAVASNTFYATASGVGSAVSAGPAAVSLNDAFYGVDAMGDWSLTIRDRGSGDTLNSGFTWSIGVATVPAPGALALLGLAGITGLPGFRRSRR